MGNGFDAETDSRRNLVAPDTLLLAEDVIHGISNPIARPSHALHVYGRALANPARSLWNPFTFEEEQFRLPVLSGYEREMTRRDTRLNSGADR
jgi:hypothetical protein